MRRKSFAQDDCPLAQAADYLGDAWTLLILRNLFNGMGRFEDLREHLEIPTNTLTDRLRLLVARGILTRQPDAGDGRRHLYRLTQKGRELYPVIVALVQWGERWESSPRGPRVILTARTDGQPVADMHVQDRSGATLGPRDVIARPGPAAGPRLRRLYRSP